MASKEEAAQRIWQCRQDGCWQAVMDYLDIELASLGLKLEKAGVEEFRKVQGRILALRLLRKAMLGQHKQSDDPE